MAFTDHARQLFFAWVDDHHEALARFFKLLPAEVLERLDYSFESLDVLERWWLQRYAAVADVRPSSGAPVLDGVARYPGETLIQMGGGSWSLETVEDDAFFCLPVVIDLPAGDLACPLFLARAALSRRSGKVWRTAVESYLEP